MPDASWPLVASTDTDYVTEGWNDFRDELSMLHFNVTGTFESGSQNIGHGDFADSWINIQRWGDRVFPPEPSDAAAVEDIEAEIKAAGGIRFCCYGSVPRVQVKLIGNMADLANRISHTQDLQSFEVSKYSDYFMLKFPDQSVFAQASELIARGLESLIGIESVEVRAFVTTASIEHVFQHAKKPGEAKLKVDINFYGSVEDADLVGQRLSAAKIYLQDPDHGTQDVDYLNPHVIHFLGIEEPVPWSAELKFSQTEATSEEAPAQRNEDNLEGTVSTLFRSLTRHRQLERITAGPQVTTELLAHQESALFFMRQRENGPIPQEYSLWSSERSVRTTIYRHKLTQSESGKVPDEVGGGILADDPGMGKTLSTLALMTTTFAQAHTWSHEDATDSRKTRTKATLVIVPSTLIMNQWINQIEKHLDKTIQVSKYYGKARDSDLKQYLERDIVLTTYHTIAASMNIPSNLVFRLDWFRVVLDEAHMIRRRETSLYQGASQLSARSRWCLTGTPIQNHLEDVGSLLAFLRVGEFENKAMFSNHVIKPFADDMKAASTKLAMLLGSVCLRRSQDLLHLPSIDETYRYIDFNGDERKQYDETLAHMARLIKENVSRSAEKKSPFGIFQAQLQLRLVCNHGTFQRTFQPHRGRDRQAEKEALLYTLGRNADVSCSRCGVPVPVFDLIGISGRRRRCRHTLCQECITGSLETSEHPQIGLTADCTMCSHHASKGTGEPWLSEQDERPYFKQTGTSSKMTALMLDLDKVVEHSKSIVFSCWTKSLDLVAMHLTQRSIPYSRIDGDQILSQRQFNMDKFTTDGDIPVLLMSTGVGAFGLNLTAASNVFILEPQWNPSVESQAVGRVARLGQKRPVKVIRYLVRRTVEVKMHTQQLRKLELAQLGSQGHSNSSQ